MTGMGWVLRWEPGSVQGLEHPRVHRRRKFAFSCLPVQVPVPAPVRVPVWVRVRVPVWVRVRVPARVSSARLTSVGNPQRDLLDG